MIVEIEGRQVERIEYKNHPVVTLRMIDELHERPEGTARKSFNRNKAQLVENEDYFDVPYEEWSEIANVHLKDVQEAGRRGSIIFLTESGYLMVVKPFGDDLAWKVQRALVRNYFVAREMLRNASPAYDPEVRASLKQTVSLLGSLQEELASVRQGLERRREIDRELPYLMQQGYHPSAKSVRNWLRPGRKGTCSETGCSYSRIISSKSRLSVRKKLKFRTVLLHQNSLNPDPEMNTDMNMNTQMNTKL